MVESVSDLFENALGARAKGPFATSAACALLLCLAGSPDVRAEEPMASDLARQLDSLFEGLPHATFEWGEAKGVSSQAALRVPVTLDGTEGWFQLDTGLDVTLVYGDMPTDRGWETYDGMYHVSSFDVGDMHLGPTWLRSRPEQSQRDGLLGSLGLDLLVGYVVLIDYPARRLALMRHGEMPRWLLERTSWTPATLRDAKLFVYVILGGKGMDGVFFDTGSSALSLMVDLETWVELTGCSGPDDAPTRWAIKSWGNTVTAIGAPARGSLVIGSVHIPDPQVFYLKESPRFFEQWPFPATGLIGNAPFRDRVVVLDLGMRQRLGIVQ